MIETKDLFNFLKKEKIEFFSGVPDSVLKKFTSLIPINKNFITTNEGAAVALASGYYLKKNKLPLVYMQNSGLGNAINPLVSLVNKKVYSIPMVLIIGWRGMPGIKDEPQHEEMGKITLNFLKIMKIKYIILKNKSDLFKLKKILRYSRTNKVPVACLVPPRNLLCKNNNKNNNTKNSGIKRSTVITQILNEIKLKKEYNLISTTGYTSRELFEIQSSITAIKCKILYVVGSMGHTSSIALGASFDKKSKIICLDGDGSLLMHMGSLNDISCFAGKNFKHILFNNHSHESVGGQTTKSKNIDFKSVVLGIGYKKYFKINKKENIRGTLSKFIKAIGPAFLEIKIDEGTFKKLGRPKKFFEIRKKFMK